MKYASLVTMLLAWVGMQHALWAQLPVFIKSHYDTSTGKPLGRLPDFSYAGHKGSGALPTRRALNERVFRVGDYGALPNDGKDDLAGIQKAVDAAGKAGGGVVLLPPGRFDFDVERVGGFIKIPYSNVVVRGYGEGVDGTTIYDHKGSTWPNEKEKWRSGEIPSFFSIGHTYSDTENTKDSLQILGHRIGRVQEAGQHGFSLELKETDPTLLKNLKVGDVIRLAIRGQHEKDSSVLFYATYPSKTIGKNLASLKGVNAWKVNHLYEIAAIEGNKLTFTRPLLVPVQKGWLAAVFKLQKPMVRNSGIEALHLKTAWDQEFHHHLNSLHDDGFDAINLSNTLDCWVRNIVFDGVSKAVNAGTGLGTVVYDCRIKGNRGHNGFLLNGACTYGLLYQLQGATQLHTLGLANAASGNVMLRCTMDEPGGLDCHGGLGVYNLVDNLVGGVYASGGASGNTPPGIGTGLITYNWLMGAKHPYNYRVAGATLDATALPGSYHVGTRHVYDWPVQYKPRQTAGIDQHSPENLGMPLWWESVGTKVAPQSLYLWQAQKRGLKQLLKEEE